MGAPLMRVEAGRAGDLDAARVAAQARAIYADSYAPEPIPAAAECMWVEDRDGIAARCVLGEATDLQGAPGITGWIGWYESRDAEASHALLRDGCTRLAARGATRVLGPFHGSTWRRYRLALPNEREDPPFFLGEPRNPSSYPQHFRDAGFSVVSTYESRVVPSAETPPATMPAGVQLRTAQGQSFDALLEGLYEFSLEAFASNLFYSPISREEFLALYEPVRRLFAPERVLLTESDRGELLGYLFSYPDHPRPVLIGKTMAVAPRARGLGLGRLLLEEIGRRAVALGFTHVLHALMREDNRSRSVSLSQGARLYRRYALYQWTP
jgi:L-amino acid N-acyltransferase YncA